MPATTPLSTVVELVGANVGTVGRRAAVITASSGLVVSMGVTVADAAPVTAPADAEPVTASQPVMDATTLAALEVAATAAAAPVVQVAPDAAASLARPSLSAATPPPPPPPPPPVRVAPAASRSTTRTAVATDTTETSERTETAAVSAAPVDAEGVRAEIMAIAARYVGIPYRYGGTTPSGFDCSGFTQYVLAQVGVSLPRTSGAQSGAGTRVSRAEAQPGDLVWQPGHIGIYAGGNLMYDSPRTGASISLREIFYSNTTFIRVL